MSSCSWKMDTICIEVKIRKLKDKLCEIDQISALYDVEQEIN